MQPILIPAAKLSKIAYANRPLPQLSSASEISYLSPEEFQQKFGRVYTESLYGDPKQLLTLSSDLLQSLRAGRPDTPSEAAILERLENPLDCLVICNMGPEVGHGLFTTKPIKAGTVLFLYAGELDEPISYGTPGRDADYTWLPVEKVGVNKVVNPSNFGGLARFMQHFPNDVEKRKQSIIRHLQKSFPAELLQRKNINLEEYAGSILAPYADLDEVGEICFRKDATRAQLESSNVKICTVVVKGVPVVIAIAEYDIEGQLGISYGKQYHESAGTQLRYFFKDGSLIPTDAYTIRTKAKSAAAATPSFFDTKPKSPQENYTTGKRAYKAKNFDEALKEFAEALEKFERLDPTGNNTGMCAYMAALCHHEKRDFVSASKYFEKCIFIFDKNNNQENLTKGIKNYKICLTSISTTPRDLYQNALSLYKEKNFHCAIVKLEMAENLFNAAPGKDLECAFCKATLASCYREIGKQDQAIIYCQQALKIREQFLPVSHKLIEDTRIKLKGLLQRDQESRIKI